MLCLSLCVCPLTAIVRALSLLRPWDLRELLLIFSVFFRGSGSTSTCSSCGEPKTTSGAHRLLCAPAGIKSRRTHDHDRSYPLLTCSLCPACYGLTTFASYDARAPALDAEFCLTAACCVVGRFGPIGIGAVACGNVWQCVTTDGRASELRVESVDGRVGVRMSRFCMLLLACVLDVCARVLARADVEPGAMMVPGSKGGSGAAV